MLNKAFLVIVFVILYFLLSFRLTNTPMGLTVDEHAFGWNAILLSRTGLDENGVKLPLFVNSINKKDWRQPVTQYYMTIFVKMFGASVYNIRLSSVVLTLFSGYLLFLLANKLFNYQYGVASLILFCTTPVIFMHSHLGLDNIMTIPFTLIWLLSLYQYTSYKNPKYLIFAGIALGVSFYTYKGMRATVPVWATLSCLYIIYLNYQSKINLIKLIRKTLPFIIAITPFFIIIPYLHQLYPGAIFGGARPKFDNIYDLFYPYLSHYDLTFLFIKGDDLLFHSTKFHGMYLLSTLPFLFIGIYQSIKHKNIFWKFILLSLITGPLLYGFVGSVHRASRILATVPSFILLTTLGLYSTIHYLKKYSYLFIFIFLSIFLFNFYDFIKYYWYTYPKFTENIFGNLTEEISYQRFHQEAKNRGLTPYVQQNIYNGLFDVIYSPTSSLKSTINDPPPANSIFLTTAENIPGFVNLQIKLPHYHLLIRQ